MTIDDGESTFSEVVFYMHAFALEACPVLDERKREWIIISLVAF